MTERITLRFDRVSLRARSAIERAGGSVHFDRRQRGFLVAMPELANWHAGYVIGEGWGAPWAVDERKERNSEGVVYYWRRARGRCVLYRGRDGVLWHWRDRQCEWALPF